MDVQDLLIMVGRNWIKKHNVELQFWGYETGNVLAAVAGVGGFFSLINSFGTIDSAPGSIDGDVFSFTLLQNKAAELFRQQPDLAVTLCIGLIVLISPLLRKAVNKAPTKLVLGFYDFSVIVLATLVLIFALRTDTSWVTVSGSSFVVASAFLRYGLQNPLYLKLGGLFLQIGGFSLCMFGISLASKGGDQLEFILGLLTVATGYYVYAAGILTYIGGKFQTDSYKNNESHHRSSMNTSAYLRLFHPVSGLVSKATARLFDFPLSALCRYVVNPSIFWLSRRTKTTKPFITSMAARLPWRIFTGTAALATATDAGVVFALANLFWAVGDVAIGSIDWVKRSDDESASPDIERVLSSGNAILLLPGLTYPNESKSVVVSQLTFIDFDIEQFIDCNGATTHVHFLGRTVQEDNAFFSSLSDYLFAGTRR